MTMTSDDVITILGLLTKLSWLMSSRLAVRRLNLPRHSRGSITTKRC
jgi:hypothetical protein